MKGSKIYQVKFRCPYCDTWSNERELQAGMMITKCYKCTLDVKMLLKGYDNSYEVYVSGLDCICLYDLYHHRDSLPFRICEQTLAQCVAVYFSPGSDGWRVDKGRLGLCPGFREGEKARERSVPKEIVNTISTAPCEICNDRGETEERKPSGNHYDYVWYKPCPRCSK